jgi:SagB-type dehydrogenase family enzyme
MIDSLAALDVGATLPLPAARTDGTTSVEAAIARRRSCRHYAAAATSLEELAQLLWAGQGMTDRRGLRAAPSAGARYPVEVLAACEDGLFRYLPEDHAVAKAADGDLRRPLATAALGQSFMAGAPVCLALTAVYERTTSRYGERGLRYVHMDVACAAENIHLQAEALGLSSVAIGAFDDRQIQKVLGLEDDEAPLYLIPVGRSAG